MSDFVKGVRRPRVLLAGYGAFGAVHARGWATNGLADRLTIADPDDEARKRAAADAPRARVVADWRRALADADIVDVVVPTDRHAEVALTALDAGCDVLIEKPMAASRAEAEAIATRAAAGKLVVQVAFPLRVHPLFRRLWTSVAAGGLGTLHWVEAEFVSLKRPRADSGVVLNDAIHVLDLVCALMGGTPNRIVAAVGHPLRRRHEDTAMIVMTWPAGAIGRVDASCVVPGDRPDPVVPRAWSRKRVSLTGSLGQATLDFVADTLEIRWGGMRRDRDGFLPVLDPPSGVTPHPTTIDDLVHEEIRGFLDCVARRTEPECNARACGVALAELCETILASARESAPILLSGPA